MAVQLLAYQVADLCLGKPPLSSLPASSATVADALAALKSTGESSITLWSCDHASPDKECVCVGKICTVDVICHLRREENLASPAAALQSPATVLVPRVEGLVRHVDPSSSRKQRKQLQKPSPSTLSTNHNDQEFCWLTHEDFVRFLLGLIGLFSPIPTLPIETLGIISHDYPVVSHHSPASSALETIHRASIDQTSVALLDELGSLTGEISPFTLLTAGDLTGSPEELVRAVEEWLRERMGFLTGGGNCCSSDDELASPTTPGGMWARRACSSRMMWRDEATVCGPGSSLVAVMIQAIARRVGSVWVVDRECRVVGMVTFASMLGVFRDCLESLV
ncbi:CBS domain-containing protein CBSX5 [Striga hermonthica]|uniref:CBS domain-containing protein CBSX5 n=1 Tax=Striga hermonthica TaxID=68872 RepID=A0A9N7ML28_STRHE|nr:CBS domain-containing protein CBSX5 [Striga hermonthica]